MRNLDNLFLLFSILHSSLLSSSPLFSSLLSFLQSFLLISIFSSLSSYLLYSSVLHCFNPSYSSLSSTLLYSSTLHSFNPSLSSLIFPLLSLSSSLLLFSLPIVSIFLCPALFQAFKLFSFLFSSSIPSVSLSYTASMLPTLLFPLLSSLPLSLLYISI